MFSKIDIRVSRGRSLIGWAGVLTKWPSPIVPKFPSRGNFGDDGHVALGNESGFPKFPKIKYLGGDFVSGKAVHVWHFFHKICFLKMICRIWTLWFRLRTVTNWESWAVVTQMNRTGLVPLPGAFGDVYRFWRLCWGFRELDSNSWYLFLTTLMCFFALHVHWCA